MIELMHAFIENDFRDEYFPDIKKFYIQFDISKLRILSIFLSYEQFSKKDNF